ncbi:hypothetical protein BX616_010464 [Lobosporangium transversale]|uniref:Uncharacterized protein n=1 Tax=Lobosporangium transversale TaxID=64571 RepID=A0A1Y2GBT3_9FUNG|nr:hypothetical protein BCR41DRAFT_400947 [Lobosporangium transversale]KAF9911859.1 hypothetical protein BX616_010464 [Lobosporangium transversale]ORZ04688.1 hypothetical protein BCR41DRAFT_400947 [Lobosporangium transversale]|eukprot:XP_021876685.1 hypothetical protein BCR41DRAFT_400947 [Lobosporangium transversale]
MGIEGLWSFLLKKGYEASLHYHSSICSTSNPSNPLNHDAFIRFDVLGPLYPTIRNAYSNHSLDTAHKIMERALEKYGASRQKILFCILTTTLDVVVSRDSDMFAYRNISTLWCPISRGRILVYKLADVLAVLYITRLQLTVPCIVSKNDYTCNISRLGNITNYKIVKEQIGEALSIEHLPYGLLRTLQDGNISIESGIHSRPVPESSNMPVQRS